MLNDGGRTQDDLVQIALSNQHTAEIFRQEICKCTRNRHNFLRASKVEMSLRTRIDRWANVEAEMTVIADHALDSTKYPYKTPFMLV